MNISVQAQAVLLLTAWFTKPGKNEPKPLTPTEWGRFAIWLKEKGLSPESLLTGDDPLQDLSGWSDRSITPERISHLLGRAGALGLALEKWQRAGLWVMTRSDPDYPILLKKRLKFDAPPVLFGCGNRLLLDQGGIAVIGSREATDTDLAFTNRLGGDIALQGYTVVSGGARGVDETAMLGALDKEGTVIGVLSDSLLRAATSAKYRKSLMANNLVLVSPFNPEAGFDVGNAMARNKYIYCLADAAVVVATGKDKGGTWSGAVENLKQGWVPLWVKPHSDSRSGNAALVERGARWLPEGALEIASLISSSEAPSLAPVSLFDASIPPAVPENEIREPSPEPFSAAAELVTPPSQESQTRSSASGPEESAKLQDLSLYDFFLMKMALATHATPMTAEALQECLMVSKPQLNDWLKRAMADGKVTKLNKPIRYQAADAGQRSLDL